MNKILKYCLFIFVIVIFQIKTPAQINSVLPYNYQDTTAIPIEMSIVKEISTKDNLQEGDIVEFKVHKDIWYNKNKIVSSGDIVSARIESIITSGMNGFPYEIIIDNFNIPFVKNTQSLSLYVKTGTNRCYWVYPLKWALTPIPFVGSLTNLIKGGHAKIKYSDIITLYYFPNWK